MKYFLAIFMCLTPAAAAPGRHPALKLMGVPAREQRLNSSKRQRLARRRQSPLVSVVLRGQPVIMPGELEALPVWGRFSAPRAGPAGLSLDNLARLAVLGWEEMLTCVGRGQLNT